MLPNLRAPEPALAFSQARMLSPGDRCKTFDARARPPSFVNGVRSKLSMSISRLVAM